MHIIYAPKQTCIHAWIYVPVSATYSFLRSWHSGLSPRTGHQNRTAGMPDTVLLAGGVPSLDALALGRAYLTLGLLARQVLSLCSCPASRSINLDWFAARTRRLRAVAVPVLKVAGLFSSHAKEQHTGGVEGTGTPFRDCARGCTNCGQSRPMMSAIDVTVNTFFERLYLVLGLGTFGP